MGSHPDSVNVLEYLRSKSSVDCDSLDLKCTCSPARRTSIGIRFPDESSVEGAGPIR